MNETNALTLTNNNLVVVFFPGMASLFQAFVLYLGRAKKVWREEATVWQTKLFPGAAV